VVPEMNLGQIVHKVKEAVGTHIEVIKLSRIGGVMHSPQEIMAVLKE
jgi:2-oxoglutarate ferredoxin oxidoreductase subunit alpha